MKFVAPRRCWDVMLLADPRITMSLLFTYAIRLLLVYVKRIYGTYPKAYAVQFTSV